MQTKLKKEAIYAGIYNGSINYGRYLGRVPGWYLFEGSPYSTDHGNLARGVHEELIENWTLIEISVAGKKPGVNETYNGWPSEVDARNFLIAALPE